MKPLEVGQLFKTTVVAVTKDCVFIDCDSKSEGVIDIAEYTDENGNATIKEGDSVSVYFIGLKDGEMRFTAKISGENADNQMLENAYKNQIPVEGHVEKEIKGGFEVKLGTARAFCPFSQMGYKQKEEPAFYFGKSLSFIITEYKENGKNILVSNRAVCENEHKKFVETLRTTVKEGSKVSGTVVSLHNYGAFVDIGGFQALLPVSEISRTRVSDISTELAVGQKIEALVIKTDWEHERVSLSLKALLADPWDNVAEKYKVDAKYEGKISRVADFGLFVSLEDGIDGLVHISELDDAGRNTNLRKLYKIGDKFSVVINSIDTEEKRISLRPSSSPQQDDDAKQYLEHQADSGTDTYNPFAVLLKK